MSKAWEPTHLKENAKQGLLTTFLERLLKGACCLPEIDENALDYADKVLSGSDELAEEQLVDAVRDTLQEEAKGNAVCVGVPVAEEVEDGDQTAKPSTNQFRPAHGGYPEMESTKVQGEVANEAAVTVDEVGAEEEPRYELKVEAPSREVTHVVLVSEMSRVSETRLVGKREAYTRCVVMEVKNRFGKPERTNANVLAVRRYALDIMTRHGVRPTHIAKQLPMVIELVFACSGAELEAEHMQATLRMAEERRNGYSWFRRLVHAVTGVSPQRRWY